MSASSSSNQTRHEIEIPLLTFGQREAADDSISDLLSCTTEFINKSKISTHTTTSAISPAAWGNVVQSKEKRGLALYQLACDFLQRKGKEREADLCCESYLD